MEFISKALAQVQRHLGGLSASGKVLMALMVAIMTGAIVWLFMWSGQPELVPLLDQNLSQGQLGNMQNQLDMWSVTYRVDNGKILVRQGRRAELMARLQMANAMPADTAEAWEKWVLEMNMWVPAQERRERWRMAKQQYLGQIIGQMDGVQRAHVLINKGSKQLLSVSSVSEPSASVYIETQGGVKPGRRLVQAVRDLVSGAVDRLTPQRVSVIANGASYRLPEQDENMFSGSMLELRRSEERYFAQKISDVLGIENVLVSVYVDLETEAVRSEREEYSGQPAIKRESIEEQTSRGPTRTTMPSGKPNTDSTIIAGLTGQETSESRSEEVEFSEFRDVMREYRKNQPGAIKSIRGATVNVPHSYFVMLYQQQTGTDQQPSQEQLKPLVRTQLEEIRRQVLPVIGLDEQDSSQVQVSRFYDRQLDSQASGNLRGADRRMSLNLSASRYIKPVGLGALAVVSLMMVLMMIRKASGALEAGDTGGMGKKQVPGATLDQSDSGPMDLGQGSEGVLQDLEVDQETLNVRNITRQVANLIKDDPDTAAAMVRQWISSK